MFHSSVYGLFSNTHHILSNKTSLKFQKFELMYSMYLHYNGIKLEINNRNITGKSLNTWKLNKILQGIHGGKEIIEGNKYNKYNGNKQNLWDVAKSEIQGKLTALNNYKELSPII